MVGGKDGALQPLEPQAMLRAVDGSSEPALKLPVVPGPQMRGQKQRDLGTNGDEKFALLLGYILWERSSLTCLR